MVKFDQLIGDAVAEEARREDAGLPPRHRARSRRGALLGAASAAVTMLAIGSLALGLWVVSSVATVTAFFCFLVIAAS